MEELPDLGEGEGVEKEGRCKERKERIEKGGKGREEKAKEAESERNAEHQHVGEQDTCR